ncbi:MAG TPA: hypothetical protein VLW54_02095 [Candidatus Acidoferrales bacterium]|nr:hypothetical protein [Candidatus Acidoferrales bacterium]
MSMNASVDTSHLSGEFDPGEGRVEVHYRNSRGEEGRFEGDARTLRESGEHISLRLAPTGKRVAFAKKWVQNLSEVTGHTDSALREPVPSSNESRVLRYHKRRGSTSPLYESLRQKYPNFE